MEYEQYIEFIIKNKHDPYEHGSYRWDITQQHIDALSLVNININNFSRLSKDIHGNTALHYIAQYRNYDIFKKMIDDLYFYSKEKLLLIENNNGRNVFHTIALTGNCVSLLKCFSDFPTKCDERMWFCFASSCDYVELDKIISKYPYIVNIKYIDGSTIWHFFACSKNYYQIPSDKLKLLQKLTYKNHKGFTINDCYNYSEKIYKKLKEVNAPKDFLCPISVVIMNDPVVSEYGISYDRSSITKWFLNSDKDPSTGKKVSTKQLFPNIYLRSKIKEYLEKD